jgi:hypothetical protein
MMAVLIGGSGAVALIAAASSVWTVVLSIVAAVAAASDAAFGWVVLARDHADLARRFYDVLAAVENGCDSEADCRRLRGSLVTLYGDELPPMRAVDAVAYNAAQRSLYGDDGKRLRVRWWESAFRHLWPFSGADFPMVAD